MPFHPSASAVVTYCDIIIVMNWDLFVILIITNICHQHNEHVVEQICEAGINTVAWAERVHRASQPRNTTSSSSTWDTQISQVSIFINAHQVPGVCWCCSNCLLSSSVFRQPFGSVKPFFSIVLGLSGVHALAWEKNTNVWHFRFSRRRVWRWDPSVEVHRRFRAMESTLHVSHLHTRCR
jgi:hypothetical protein